MGACATRTNASGLSPLVHGPDAMLPQRWLRERGAHARTHARAEGGHGHHRTRARPEPMVTGHRRGVSWASRAPNTEGRYARLP
jgi:hypothetical protein